MPSATTSRAPRCAGGLDGARPRSADDAAALEGAAERDLVGVLEVAADGQARGEARDRGSRAW